MFKRIASSFSSLRAKLALAAAGMVFLTALAIALIGYSRLGAKIAEDVETRTLWSLRVATRITQEALPVFAVQRNAQGEPEFLKLTQPTALLDNFSVNELTQVVDAISDANRGTATIFRWQDDKKDFIRVATTVKKPDGSRAVGTYLGQGGKVYPFMMRQEAYRGIAIILGEPYQTGYMPIVDSANKPVGILYIGVGKMSELAASTYVFLRDLVIGSLLVLALGVLMILIVTDRLFRPLRAVAAATDQLASGAVDCTIPHQSQPDEIGTIARAVAGFSEAVTKQRELEQNQQADAQRMAERKLEMDRQVELFRVSVGSLLSRLKSGAEEVRKTSGSIQGVVAHVNSRVGEGRDAADDGAGAISEVATATNQFASSIAEIAGRSNEAATIVRRASETGQHAESVASELAVAVEKIATAVAFISSIASQTNLLALNATIEAARAGEAGKGFAVVASEVKELSNGTSKAATEIADLVRSIEGVTQAVTGATREIGQGLSSINETTLVIAAAVTEQEQVTRDIAANADSAAQRSDIVRAGFTDVLGAIENATEAASQLDTLSHDFAHASDQLVNEIEGFLQRMAA
ncbi:MAG TPA: methyl-accepting chemotaxis protein [Rhabdaerophilum sp.]|nr:methyl-accepting chemotaxis protein [Rhabdaerophilum sp.]